MATKNDVLRLREQTTDSVLFDHLSNQDAEFRTAVERVRTQNPNMNALEKAKFPTAMIDIFYEFDKKKSSPLTTQMASSAMEVPEQKGLFGRIGEDITERGERFRGGIERQAAGEQALPSTALQLAGETIGGAFDIAGEAAGAAFRALPDFIEEPIREGVSTAGQFFAETEAGQAVLNAIQQGAQAFEQLQQTNPEIAENLRAIANIASVLPISRARGAVQPGLVTKAAEGRLAKQVTREAVRETVPTLAKGERIAGLEAGRGRGVIKRTLEPSGIDIKVAQSVEDVITKGRPLRNIDKINKKIVSSSKAIDEQLIKEGGIFNEAEITTFLNSAKQESQILFGTEKSIENAYDAVIGEYTRLLREEGFTVGGSIKARRKFDQVIKKKFPNIFKKIGGDNTRANAVFDVRKAVNDFAASKLPEGNALKQNLLDISDMFSARKNISTRLQGTLDIGIAERAIRAMRDNPLIAGVTGGILTFGALTGLLSNPIVIGGLLAGGSVKIAGKVITSKTLKRALIAGEKVAKKSKDTAAITAIRELINTFEESEQSTTQQ